MGLDLKEDKREAVGGSDDRRKEFRHLIDKNKNGKADRTELLVINLNLPFSGAHLLNLLSIDLYILRETNFC